ncbi:hypothetical protein LCGC14_1101800 [marine sediment metagenome]|uniref:Uncharacterized protein n=1 Tax=marine sediment metagenome TaxID=412755 RepID=A0A0F9MX45_9ZZZZ
MPIVIETLDEFVERHGGNPMSPDHHVQLLPTGAAVVPAPLGMPGSGPRLVEPPDDPVLCQKQILLYLTLREKVAVDTFVRLKQKALGIGDGPHSDAPFDNVLWRPNLWGKVPQPQDDDEVCLKALVVIVERERAALKAAKEIFHLLPEVVAKKQAAAAAEKVEQQRQAEVLELRDRINKINI